MQAPGRISVLLRNGLRSVYSCSRGKCNLVSPGNHLSIDHSRGEVGRASRHDQDSVDRGLVIQAATRRDVAVHHDQIIGRSQLRGQRDAGAIQRKATSNNHYPVGSGGSGQCNVRLGSLGGRYSQSEILSAVINRVDGCLTSGRCCTGRPCCRTRLSRPRARPRPPRRRCQGQSTSEPICMPRQWSCSKWNPLRWSSF